MTTFIIEELDSGRSLVLSGRSLPRRGVSFPTRMRQETTWYAGSNVGTMQVLGMEEMPTDVEGRWSDKWLAEQVEVQGWPEVVLAADLVAIFQELASIGSRLRVQWGPQVRTGILEEFDPKYDREEDVNWSASFAWYSRDDAQVERAFVDATPQAAPAQAAMNALDDEAAYEPPQVSRDYVAEVAGHVSSIRSNTSFYVASVQQVAQFPSPPLGHLNDVVDASRRIAADVAARIRGASGPLDEMIVSTRASDRIRGDLARRTVSRRAADLRGEVDRTARRLVRQVRPRAQVVAQVKEGQSLRTLARIHYGTSDEWRRIASANGLVGSMVAPGTRLVIPDLAEPARSAC